MRQHQQPHQQHRSVVRVVNRQRQLHGLSFQFWTIVSFVLFVCSWQIRQQNASIHPFLLQQSSAFENIWSLVSGSLQMTMVTTNDSFLMMDSSRVKQEDAGATQTPATDQQASRRNNSRLLCGHIDAAVARQQRRPQSHLRTPRILLSNADYRNQQQRVCRPNAILYMVQKGTHSSYGRNSTALFLRSLDLLYQNYLSIDHHFNNVDVLIFHSGDYAMEDLQMIDHRYNSTVSFQLIDLNHTDYWSIPEWIQHDNISQWVVYPQFSVGYRHMMRWYALKLYDFIRDYVQEGGCPRYQYVMRMDEDSYIHSPIQYDLFQFMQQHNYSYAFRMCSYELELDVWDDYMDHVRYCRGRSGASSSLLPAGTPYRTFHPDLCGFYNNFFIIDMDFALQPNVQHFLQWIDATGIIYRERYNDLQIQTFAVYAFAPPERIHRFLDWTYEHMTYTLTRKGLWCPIFGAIQAGYLHTNITEVDDTFNSFTRNSNMFAGRCQGIRIRKVFKEVDMSPTYAHLPKSEKWWKEHVSATIPRHEFEWKTFAAALVEKPYRGNLSG